MEPLDFPKHTDRMVDQAGLVRGDFLAAQSAQVVACRAERDRADVVRRARFQAQGKLLPSGQRLRHLPHHLAAEITGGEHLERLARAAKRTDTRARHHLVAGKSQVVDAQIRDVDHAMAHDLRAVEHEQGARVMGHLGESFDGGHGAEHVRAPRHRDDLHLPIGEQLRITRLIKIALGGEPGNAEIGTRGRTRLLPGNIVGVVLHKAHHDGIVGPEHMSQAAGNHVQAVGRAAREHHARRIGRADEAGDRIPRVLKCIGRGVRQVMHPTMHVRVARPIVLRNSGKHLFGNLRRRRVVQVHERMAMNLLSQNREILAYAFHIHVRHPFHPCV